MAEKIVEVTHKVAVELWGGPADSHVFKNSVVQGAEMLRSDGSVSVITKGIPADSVVAEPEPRHDRRTWEYRVISDEWTDDDPWFLPEITLVQKENAVG